MYVYRFCKNMVLFLCVYGYGFEDFFVVRRYDYRGDICMVFFQCELVDDVVGVYVE